MPSEKAMEMANSIFTHTSYPQIPRKIAEFIDLWKTNETEVKKLRQTHWDMRVQAGFDNDGDPTPEAIVSNFSKLMIDDWNNIIKNQQKGHDEWDALQKENEKLTAEIDRLRAEWIKDREQLRIASMIVASQKEELDALRKQEAIAWGITDKHKAVSLTFSKGFADHWKLNHPDLKTYNFYAAPVPAQPAVPDDVAKDAAEVVAYRIHYPGGAKRLTEDGDVYEHEKRAGLKIDWLGVVGGIDAAILSDTDAEGRSNG